MGYATNPSMVMAEAYDIMSHVNGKTYFMFQGDLIELYKTDISLTGCNIDFADDDGYQINIYTPDGVRNEICEKHVYDIMDGVVTWFLYPEQAVKFIQNGK
jgi:hypothetical protein